MKSARYLLAGAGLVMCAFGVSAQKPGMDIPPPRPQYTGPPEAINPLYPSATQPSGVTCIWDSHPVRAEAYKSGRASQHGVGVPPDPVLAEKKLLESVRRKDSRRMLHLGWSYLFGDGIRQDRMRGLEFIEKVARQYCVDGQLAYARLHLSGMIGSRDFSKAQREFARIHQYAPFSYRGVAAWRVTGVLTLLGRGQGDSERDGIRVLERANDHGDPIASRWLEIVYTRGLGVAVDPSLAERWRRVADERDPSRATWRCDILAHYGYGSDVWREESLRDMERAGEAGDYDSARCLSQAFTDPRLFMRDAARAMRWRERTAELGSAVEKFEVGLAHYLGEGGPVDQSRAAAWFEKAAREGEARAMRMLASMESTGDGVEFAPESAAAWDTLAGEYGDVSPSKTDGPREPGVDWDHQRYLELLAQRRAEIDAARMHAH